MNGDDIMTKHERKVKYDISNSAIEGKFELLEPVNVWGLNKIQNAIEMLKEENAEEMVVSLTLAELTTIRRLLITDDLNTELCRDNLIEGLEFSKIKREV